MPAADTYIIHMLPTQDALQCDRHPGSAAPSVAGNCHHFCEARTHMPYLTTVPHSAAKSLSAMCQKPTLGGSGVFHAGGNGRGTANTFHTACSARDQGRVECSGTSHNGLMTFQAPQSMNTSTFDCPIPTLTTP